jgi:ComF family protein
MRRLIHYIKEWLFPPKCILCQGLLSAEETDLCRRCRAETDEYPQGKLKLQFIDRAAAVWYYKGNVRHSLHRFKFRRCAFLAEPYGKLMAMKLLTAEMAQADLITWVPISPVRRFFRGYDQDQLLARVISRELGIPCRELLKKVRHNRPQSGISGYARRRANVLGVYRALNPEEISGKRIVLVDDILTTGATMSECARVLLTAGAEEVNCAVVASAHHNNP